VSVQKVSFFRLTTRVTLYTLFLWCAFTLSTVAHVAQVVTAPASSPCACDGSLTFSTSLGGSVMYELFDSAGNPVSTITNATGSAVFPNLCPQVYLLETNSGQEREAVNIPVTGFNPGSANEATVCSNQAVTEFINLIPDLAPGGTWTDPAGLPNGTSFVAASDVTGLYVYTIQQGGCDVSTGIYITRIQNANPGLFTNYLFCEIDPPFSMLSVMEGGPDAGGTWFNSSMQVVPDLFDPGTMPTETFTYVLPGIQGCPQVFTTLVCTNTVLPDPGNDASVLSCVGGSSWNMTAQLGGTPEAGGTWFAPNGTVVSATFNPVVQPAGIYRYQIPAINTCPPQQSFLTVNLLNDNPSGLSTTLTLCPQSPVVDLFATLLGNPLVGGTWRNPLNQITDSIYNPATEPPGAYQYNYPNVGCTPQNSVITIAIQATPSAGLDQTIPLCTSSTMYNLDNALSAGSSPGGQWTNIAGTAIGPSISIAAPGNYTFNYTVGGGAGCPQDVATIVLNVTPPNPPLSDFSLAFCATDAPFDLAGLYPNNPAVYFRNETGAVVNDLYQPSNPTGLLLQAVNPTGTNCPSSVGFVTISIEQPSFVDASLSAGTCSTGAPFNLETLIPVIDYSLGQWTDATGQASSPIVSTTSESAQTFIFTSLPGAQCAASVLEIEFTVNLPLDAGPNGNLVLCINNGPVVFSSIMPQTAVNPNGIWSYNGLAMSEGVFDPAVDLAGDYVFTLPANGYCPADQSVLSIQVEQGFAFTAGTDVALCSQTGSSALGGASIPGIIYQWSPSTGLSDVNVSNPTISTVNVGTGVIEQLYQLTASDGTCTFTDEVLVRIFPLPSAPAGESISVCEGETVLLNGSSGLVHQWSPFVLFSNPALPSQTITAVGNEQIQLVVSNEWQCSDTSLFSLTVHPLPDLSLPDSTYQACSPARIEFESTSTNTALIEWYIDGEKQGEGETLAYVFPEGGLFNVTATATSMFECKDSVEVPLTVIIEQSPSVDFRFDPPSLSPMADQLVVWNDSQFSDTYFWSLDGDFLSEETHVFFEVSEQVTREYEFCLRAENEAGCSDSLCRRILYSNDYILYAPNAFTPDNDGLNDVFLPVLIGFDARTYTLHIFDRWGVQVFSTNDPRQGWLGNVLEGSYYAQPDVYNWRVEVKEQDRAEYRVFQGMVLLLR
jgi:gliding motility-associated-like protein